jgi:hypothetical protein
MLQELIDIIGSAEFQESESWLYIDSVNWPNAAELSLLLTLYCGEQEPQAWRVSCDHVLAYRFLTRKTGSLTLTLNHPVLWPHTMPHKDLYVSSRPADAAAVFGSLVEAHLGLVGTWFPLLRFINHSVPTIQLLSGGNGLLATGPQPIVDRFSSLLGSYGVRHNVLPYAHGKIAYNSDLPPMALLLGDSYVAALNIEGERCEQ